MITQINTLLFVCSSLLLLFKWAKQLKSESLFSERVQEGDWKTINGVQFISIAILSVPVLLDPTCFLGYWTITNVSLFKLIGLLASISAVAVFIQCNKLEEQSFHVPANAVASVRKYVMMRIVYIIMYEWFLRGLMLGEMIEWLGLAAAIFLNLGIYILLHAHKSRKEMIGCIPFGLLVCVLTIWWDSVWPAVILHLQLCLTYELAYLKKYLLFKKQATL
jgi:membrane protease YdiL (CAAX protease family)